MIRSSESVFRRILGRGPSRINKTTTVKSLYSQLKKAEKIVIIPGSGLISSNAFKELEILIESLPEGKITLVISPFVGQFLGHLSVVLPDSLVRYCVFEQAQFSSLISQADLVIAIGAKRIISFDDRESFDQIFLSKSTPLLALTLSGSDWLIEEAKIEILPGDIRENLTKLLAAYAGR